MNQVTFLYVRLAVIEKVNMSQLCGRQKLLFEGMECVFWFVDKSWFEVGDWPCSLMGYPEDQNTRANFEYSVEIHREAAKMYWKGRKDGEGFGPMAVHSVQEVVDEFERRRRA